jgi:hypothetical protein
VQLCLLTRDYPWPVQLCLLTRFPGVVRWLYHTWRLSPHAFVGRHRASLFLRHFRVARSDDDIVHLDWLYRAFSENHIAGQPTTSAATVANATATAAELPPNPHSTAARARSAAAPAASSKTMVLPRQPNGREWSPVDLNHQWDRVDSSPASVCELLYCACYNGAPRTLRWVVDTFGTPTRELILRALRWSVRRGVIASCEWLVTTYALTPDVHCDWCPVWVRDTTAITLLKWARDKFRVPDSLLGVVRILEKACEGGANKLAAWILDTIPMHPEEVDASGTLRALARNDLLDLAQHLHRCYPISRAAAARVFTVLPYPYAPLPRDNDTLSWLRTTFQL